MEKLSPQMQDRLDKWKKNTLPTKKFSTLPKQSPGTFVSRKRDFGDDLEEFKYKGK